MMLDAYTPLLFLAEIMKLFPEVREMSWRAQIESVFAPEIRGDPFLERGKHPYYTAEYAVLPDIGTLEKIVPGLGGGGELAEVSVGKEKRSSASDGDGAGESALAHPSGVSQIPAQEKAASPTQGASSVGGGLEDVVDMEVDEEEAERLLAESGGEEEVEAGEIRAELKVAPVEEKEHAEAQDAPVEEVQVSKTRARLAAMSEEQREQYTARNKKKAKRRRQAARGKEAIPHFDPTLQALNSRMAEPTLYARCTGCGSTSHFLYFRGGHRVRCPVFEDVEPKNWSKYCEYPYCRSSGHPHITRACPELHGVCRLCKRRGHRSHIVCAVESEGKLREIYDSFKGQGILTKEDKFKFVVHDLL